MVIGNSWWFLLALGGFYNDFWGLVALGVSWGFLLVLGIFLLLYFLLVLGGS